MLKRTGSKGAGVENVEEETEAALAAANAPSDSKSSQVNLLFTTNGWYNAATAMFTKFVTNSKLKHANYDM